MGPAQPDCGVGNDITVYEVGRKPCQPHNQVVPALRARGGVAMASSYAGWVLPMLAQLICGHPLSFSDPIAKHHDQSGGTGRRPCRAVYLQVVSLAVWWWWLVEGAVRGGYSAARLGAHRIPRLSSQTKQPGLAPTSQRETSPAKEMPRGWIGQGCIISFVLLVRGGPNTHAPTKEMACR